LYINQRDSDECLEIFWEAIPIGWTKAAENKTFEQLTDVNKLFACCRVTLEDLYNGKTTSVTVDRQVICAKCQG